MDGEYDTLMSDSNITPIFFKLSVNNTSCQVILTVLTAKKLNQLPGYFDNPDCQITARVSSLF